MTGLVTGAAILATAAVSLAVVSITMREVLLEDLRTYLRRTVESTAALIDGPAHARLIDSRQTGSPEYRAVNAPLRALLRTNPDIKFAFSGFVRGNTMFFVLDGDTTSQGAKVMEPDLPTEGEREIARTGRTVVDRKPTPSTWGTGIRAFAPIASAQDGVHPYVGITVDAVRYDAWLRRVYTTAALGLAVAALIALVVGIRTARAAHRRDEAERSMARMREAATASAEERHALEQRLQGRQKTEALGTLAGGVAHDFNNLLAVILGHAELLTEDVTPGTEQGDSIAAIRTAAGRARDVVRRILLFARPEAEHRESLALVPIIDETVGLLRSTLPSSVEIVWQRPRKPVPAVLADPAQITQVLMNLGVNASHALRDERGRVEISLERVVLDDEAALRLTVTSGAYARIRVRDDGVGMSDEVRRRIFEPFYTTKAADKGTGLGLSVVEGVVRGHQGALEVESWPGTGSVFTVYLPEGSGLVARPPSGRPARDGEISRGARVMMVDDDRPVLNAIAKVLRRAGFAVDAFDDANQALEVLQAADGAYDVLVTDRSMPKMSGLEVAQRAHAIFPGLPVVLLSGAPKDGDRDSEHFAAMVAKPPDSTALVAAIERSIIASRHAGRRLPVSANERTSLPA